MPFNTQWTIFQYQERIKELQEDLIMETMVKKSEIERTKGLLDQIETQNVHTGTLVKINEEYAKLIGKLRSRIKELDGNL